MVTINDLLTNTLLWQLFRIQDLNNIPTGTIEIEQRSRIATNLAQAIATLKIANCASVDEDKINVVLANYQLQSQMNQ